MNFLSHMLVLLLMLAPGFPGGVVCKLAPMNGGACGPHASAASAPTSGGSCAQACHERGTEPQCEASPEATELAMLAKTPTQPSQDVAMLPWSSLVAGDRHLPRGQATGESGVARKPSLQTQRVRLQV